MIIVLEGLPASGKTSIANYLASIGFLKVNESLGKIGGANDTDDQRVIFEETVNKYALAKSVQPKNAAIDRGYPSMLSWDYTAEVLEYAQDLQEKTVWVTGALKSKDLFEPDLYIYLQNTAEKSLLRRPRLADKKDVWTTETGLNACLEFYNNFFSQPQIKSKTLSLDSTCSSITDMIMQISKIL